MFTPATLKSFRRLCSVGPASRRYRSIAARRRAGGQQQPRRSSGMWRPDAGSATLSAYNAAAEHRGVSQRAVTRSWLSFG